MVTSATTQVLCATSVLRKLREDTSSYESRNLVSKAGVDFFKIPYPIVVPILLLLAIGFVKSYNYDYGMKIAQLSYQPVFWYASCGTKLVANSSVIVILWLCRRPTCRHGYIIGSGGLRQQTTQVLTRAIGVLRPPLRRIWSVSGVRTTSKM